MDGQRPPDFQLPFEAYPSQKRFMYDAYKCFDESRFGLFESPTGSGKTIAILCSVLTWLRDNRLKDAVSRLQPNVERGANVPLWVQRSMESQLRSMAEELIKSEFDRITATRQRLKMDFTVTKDGVRLRSAVKRERERACATESEASAEALLPRQKIQIIVCSRTFSQLNQYIREFRRLGTLAEHVKIGMATGRSHVCINTSARARCQTNEEFNDYCRNTSCDFRDDVGPLAEAATCFPMDVEDLKAVGTGLCSCPYYAAAKIVPECDVILAPYVSVFNESIRENMGIKTEGNILIVDEAHNLMNAVAEAQSSLVSVKAMSALSLQCKSYLAKFHGRLDEKQSSTIADIEKVASTLSEYRKLGAGEPGKVEAEELSIPSFIVALGLENAKFHELVAFLVSGDFCKKLRSFAERLWHGKLKRSEAAHDPAQNNYVSAVYEFRHFISTILSAGKHDRILVSSAPGDTTIELFSVSADEQFQALAKGARSVVLMSGTLSPVEEFVRLAPCGVEPILHRSPPVFPADRFYATVIGKDEQGVALVYDSNSRERQRELSVLCRIVEVLAAVVPNGIVCFFASYNFLQKFRAVFEQSPEKVNVLKTKALFFETQEKGKTIFAEYSKQAFSKGAILFAVYGGSQSEGVDFADGLARLVLLVGQPYPPDGIKLQLRRDYFRSRSLQLELPKQRREIYATLANEIKTILCYKSINQSIGRAMRHKDDYAAIVLLDARYTDARAQRLLPCYVTQALQNTSEHGNKAFSRNVLKNNLTEFYRFQNKRT